jgi:hypothetical protein
MTLTEILQLANSVLEAAVVILISSVLLYGIQSSIRNRVAWASSLLLGFTVIAYLVDLFLTQTSDPMLMERWLRVQWLGVAFVPSAYLQLSVALFESSGSARPNPRRRLLVMASYAVGAAAVALAAFTDLIVYGQVANLTAPQLRPGLLFPLFAVGFGILIGLGFWLQLQARRRSRTGTMRRRITFIIASAGGPAISVFPYLLLTGQSTVLPPPLFWIVQVLGNAAVGITIFFMTYSVAYFGVTEPDRVVRLRLIKFLARGPLVAIVALILMILVGRAGQFLGLPADRAINFVVVVSIVVLQWLIALVKPRLERWFYFGEREQLARIQELRDRLVTTQDLRQFLENVLASVCDLLQVNTAFVASYASDGTPRLEVILGALQMDHGETPQEHLLSLTRENPLDSQVLPERLSWNGYWIFRLQDRAGQATLGILGTEARRVPGELTAEQSHQLTYLTEMAASALEDQVLQQEVFAALEGLLQKTRATEWQRKAMSQEGGWLQPDDLARQEGFVGMVRDALSHYWGGPKLTESPLLRMAIVRKGLAEHQGNAVNAMRAVLLQAVESLRPEGQRNLTTTEWILFNILELKFIKGHRVRDIARRLAMSESDLYRKQRVAIEAVARALVQMEQAAQRSQAASSPEVENDPT